MFTVCYRLMMCLTDFLLTKHVIFLFAVAFLKHPITPTVPGMDYQTADSEHLMKRILVSQSDEVYEGKYLYNYK